MALGKYQLAQTILDDHKISISNYFSPDHPANCSVVNNQALLHKLNGKYELAKEMFKEVYERISKGTDKWNALTIQESPLFSWDEKSTYIKRPPFFEPIHNKVDKVKPIENARVLLKIGRAHV